MKSKAVVYGLIFLLALLSIAAGIPKILQAPRELGFLAAIGLGGLAVSGLGLIQVAGGVLLFWSRARLIGGCLAVLAFAVSSAALFAAGNMQFGLVSLLPVVVLVTALVLEGRIKNATAVQ